MSNFSEKAIDYIQCVEAALDAAEKTINEKRAADERINDLLPKAVDALIQFERIDPADREKAASALSNHAKALEILIKAADVNRTVKPKAIGKVEKQAGSYDSMNDPYVGRRTTSERESDRRFRQHLGLA
jgi:DNA-directed RNA polymerase subunit F